MSIRLALVALLAGVSLSNAASTAAGKQLYNIVVRSNAVASENELDDLVSRMYAFIGADASSPRQTGSIDTFYTVSMTLSAQDVEVLQASSFGSALEIVEEDMVVTAQATQMSCPDVQAAPSPWGLRRSVNEKVIPEGFRHNASWGQGVNVYVIDTGVDCDHPDLKGRCEQGWSAFSTIKDISGHGTHVAGTVAGTEFGFAKAANIVAIRVVGDDGSGSNAIVVAGVEASVAHARRSGKRGVINMSLGGGVSRVSDATVNAAVAAGVTVVVAAGNNYSDACFYSPARASDVITVGATTFTVGHGDERAYFSNYGSCVDIFAPGVRVNSSKSSDEQEMNPPPEYDLYRLLSGTSMASPLVAGVAAAYVSHHEKAPSPADVTKWFKDNALKDVVKGKGLGSPNLLMNVPCMEKETVDEDYKAVDENCYETYMPLPDSVNGSIVFPSEEEYYYPNGFTACWRITCQSVVELSFTDFETQAGRDLLNVYSAANLTFSKLLELSGNVTVDTSYHAGPVVVRFTSGSVQGKGFNMQYACIDEDDIPPSTPATPEPTPAPFPQQCWQTVVVSANDSEISYLDYNNNQNVCWRIECDDTVELKWESFYTQRAKDFVRVHTDVNGSFPMQEMLHGRASPPTTYHTGPVVVQFTSDGYVTADGFILQFQCLDKVPDPKPVQEVPQHPPVCTGASVTAIDATTAPAIEYTHNGSTDGVVSCWRIQCNDILTLRAPRFESESLADQVVLYVRGNWSYDRMSYYWPIAQYYGTTRPRLQHVPGSIVLYSSFRSESTTSGFVYNFTCGAGVAAQTAAPATPAPTPSVFPPQCWQQNEVLVNQTEIIHANYSNGDNYCWRVECDGLVQLDWKTFETELNYDFVYVYTHESNGSFVPQQKLHGKTLPPTTFQQGPVVVQFASDGIVKDAGFTLETTCLATPAPSTIAPTMMPTEASTIAPTMAPTDAPTIAPTMAPTDAPTIAPTMAPPTVTPTLVPTNAPTLAPTTAPFCSSDADCRIGLLDPASTCTNSSCVCVTAGYAPLSASVSLCIAQDVTTLSMSFAVLYPAATLALWTDINKAAFLAAMLQVLGVVDQVDGLAIGGLWLVGIVSANVSNDALISGLSSLADALNAAANVTTREASVLSLSDLGDASQSTVANGQSCTLDYSVSAVNDPNGVCQAVSCIATATRMEVSGQYRCILKTTAPATSAPATSAPSVTRDSDDDLTHDEKVGLGVGIGLGVPLLLGAIAAVVFCTRKKETVANEPYTA